MKVLSKPFYLAIKSENCRIWSYQKIYDLMNNFLCDDSIQRLWEVPTEIEEISIELHNKEVAGSYEVRLINEFEGYFGIGGKQELLDHFLTDMVMGCLSKHKRLFVRILY